MAEAGKTLQLTNMQEGPPRHYMVSWTQKLIYPRREEFYHVGSGSCLIWEFPSVSFISIKKNKTEPINCTMNADLLDYTSTHTKLFITARQDIKNGSN